MNKAETKAGPLVGSDKNEKYTVAISDTNKVTYWIEETQVDVAAYMAAVTTEILRRLEMDSRRRD